MRNMKVHQCSLLVTLCTYCPSHTHCDSRMHRTPSQLTMSACGLFNIQLLAHGAHQTTFLRQIYDAVLYKARSQVYVWVGLQFEDQPAGQSLSGNLSESWMGRIR